MEMTTKTCDLAATQHVIVTTVCPGVNIRTERESNLIQALSRFFIS